MNNKIIGQNTFVGSTQVANKIINNYTTNENEQKKAKYEAEPVWRSPFTQAVLGWIGVIIGIAEFIPLCKIIGYVKSFFNSTIELGDAKDLLIWTWILMLLFLLIIVCFTLRRITKRQTRHPLIGKYAISGYGNRITIEKVHIDKCPICGGDMRYYNKPVEWMPVDCGNGRIKQQVIKRIQVLECKRNSEHCQEVDSAEDKV